MPSLIVAERLSCTEAEGPGRRYALWLQGCPLRCAGCCNPEYLPFKGGEEFAIETLVEEITLAQREHGIEGISLLGGEPTAQPNCAMLAERVRSLGLSVMVYSGYTLAELKDHPLLAFTDILVDGPYDRTLPEAKRRWVGSSNQQVHFLTPRYTLDEAWTKRNTLEIRVTPDVISVNGFPAADAAGLWKGWARRS